jgi:hypothetical protein
MKLLPGEIVKQFTVRTQDPLTREPVTTDGRRVTELHDFTTTVSYVGTVRRTDGKFTLLLEWVDLDKTGHRVQLPHEVVQRVIDVHGRVMAEARSERSKRTMEARIRKGYVPHFAKQFSLDDEDDEDEEAS